MNKELKMVEHLVKLTKNDAMEWYISPTMISAQIYGVQKVREDGSEIIIALINNDGVYKLGVGRIRINISDEQEVCSRLHNEIEQQLVRAENNKYNNAMDTAMNW